jgi:hypothetical protein
MIDQKILKEFKNMKNWTNFLQERINDGAEISRGKTGGERSKEEKKRREVEKNRDLINRGYKEDVVGEAKDDKEAHDRNTKTKEVNIKKHANGAETHSTVEKEPMPDQDIEQEAPPEEQPPAPPPVAMAPGSQVKIGRKDTSQKIEPTAKKLTVSKAEQKVDMKPKVVIDTKKDYGANTMGNTTN